MKKRWKIQSQMMRITSHRPLSSSCIFDWLCILYLRRNWARKSLWEHIKNEMGRQGIGKQGHSVKRFVSSAHEAKRDTGGKIINSLARQNEARSVCFLINFKKALQGKNSQSFSNCQSCIEFVFTVCVHRFDKKNTTHIAAFDLGWYHHSVRES